MNTTNKHPQTIWIVFTLTVLLLWSSIMYITYQSFLNNKASYLDLQLKTFEGEVDSTLKTYETFSNYIHSEINRDAFVLKSLYEANTATENRKAQLRSSLYNYLLENYENMQKYDFRQLHFHLPSTESFLRMHSPSKYGDLLFDIRESVRIANEREIYVSGFEEGRIYNGFRYVYPLRYNEMHIGSVEVSISSASVLSVLSELYPKENFYFIIKKAVVNEKVFEDQTVNYIDSFISEDYYADIDVSSNSRVHNQKLGEYETELINTVRSQCAPDLSDNKSFAQLIHFRNQYYVVKFHAIDNIANKPVAYLISFSKNDDYKTIQNGFYKQAVLITLFSIMIIAFGWTTANYQRKLRNASQRDHLTHLYNRHMFAELSMKELRRLNRYGYDACIMMMDIDHFKKINDTFGHDGGDQALVDLSNLVANNIRESDIFARWGGEEFIFMLPHTSKDEALVLAEKIRKLIAECDAGILQHITVSIGVSNVNPNCKNLETSINSADEALYQAKENGRNRVCCD